MRAKPISTGITGAVFILGVVGLVPILIGSTLFAVGAMVRDVCTLIAHSFKHLHR
jgi:hypothetical protein